MPESIIDIVVVPKSSRNNISTSDTKIRVYLTSPPVEGQANRECIAHLAKKLRIPKSSITITRGLKGRRKRLKIEGLTREQIYSILRNEIL